MAWTYSDWNQQATVSAQLTRLNLHISEVAEDNAGKPDVASDGKSIAYGSSNQYLSQLYAERDKLIRRNVSRGGRSLGRVKRW